MATTLVKLLSLTAGDRIERALPKEGRLECFLDDWQIHAAGERARVKEAIEVGGQEIKQAVEVDLGCKVAADKTAILASSNLFLQELIFLMAGYGFTSEATGTTVVLGTDYSCGKQRQAKGVINKRMKIILKVRGRMQRVRLMQRVAQQGSTQKIFTIGLKAGGVYGAEVHGITNQQVGSLQQQAASLMAPASPSASRTSKLLIHKDPCEADCVAVLVRFAREVWIHQVGGPKAHELSMSELLAAWDIVEKVAKKGVRWQEVRGPLSAMVAELKRLQWTVASTSPFCATQ